VKLENGHSLNMDELKGIELVNSGPSDEWSLIARGRDGRNDTVVTGTRKECDLLHARLLDATGSTAVKNVAHLRTLIRHGK